MASSILLRSVGRVASSVVSAAAPKAHLSTSAVVAKYRMNDPIEHATGLEKWELLEAKKGNDDPFFMKARKHGKGTKEEPNIVDAMDVYRMVGCVCHEDQTHINWMWVYENEPKRCECGYWFKLKKHPAPELYKLPL